MSKKKKGPDRTLISIGEYASLCGFTTQRIYQLINEGEVPVVKIKDRMFIDMDVTPIYVTQKRGVKSAEDFLKANL